MIVDNIIMMTTQWQFDNERLVALRESLNNTQEEFASKMGIKKQQLCVWEKGHLWPGLRSLLKICSVFGVRPEFFLRQSDYHDDDTTVTK